MMWWKTKLRKRVEELETLLWIKYLSRDAVVCCEVCGCYLPLFLATKGKAEIRERCISRKPRLYSEVIYHPYYCKVHAPKEENK